MKMNLFNKMSIWNISTLLIIWLVCVFSNQISALDKSLSVDHHEVPLSDPVHENTPVYSQGFSHKGLSSFFEKNVYSKLETFQKWFNKILLSPPAWLLDMTAILPEYLQPIKVEVPSNTLESCLHTPTMDQILKDAVELHPLLKSLKQKTFFRIFKLALAPQSCAKSNAINNLVSDNKCTAPERCGVCECSHEQIPRTFIDIPNEIFVDRRHLASFYHWRDAGTHKPDDPYAKKSLIEDKTVPNGQTVNNTDDSKTSGTIPSSDDTESSSDNTIASSKPSNDDSIPSIGNKSTDKKPVPGIYVDMMLNPPGFTTYQGKEIWQILYDQIAQLQAVEDTENNCTSGKNIARIVSGMQSNISALAAEYYYVSNAVPKSISSITDSNTINHHSVATMVNERVTMPNLEFYIERFSKYPERVQNLYFTFAVLLKSMCKLSNVLQECSCDTGNSKEDLAARAELMHVLNTTTVSLNTCSSEHLVPLFDRYRLAFLSDMSRVDALLQCVPCEKCQLHGKIKLTSLSIATKMDSDGPPLRYLERNEVTAFLNALYYFADAVIIVSHMENRAGVHNLLLYIMYFIVIASICICIIKIFQKYAMYTSFNSSKKCD